ncbi:MAG: hypothetical protein U0R26_00535 [Solirubrobacterales bacterium]
MSADQTCAVCGRTILAGEQVRGYLAGDDRRTVCELCTGRAERLGWRWGEAAPDSPPPGAGGSRPAGLRGLLRRRPKQLADLPELSPDAQPSPPAPTPDPAAPGKRAGRPAAAASPVSPFERAAARFNASEAGHTVAGLARTLGVPWVSVGASAGAANQVRITVAWELSWYQWGVDLDDELRPVFELDKGLEVSQLDAAARQWNATAIEGGRIVLSAPIPADGKAVRH